MASSTNSNKGHKRKKFTGTWISAVIHQLVETGQLTPTAAYLAMVIHSFARGEKGCFASNSYLAKKIRCDERHVRRLLVDLERVHILVSVWKGRMRYLIIDMKGEASGTRVENYSTNGRKDFHQTKMSRETGHTGPNETGHTGPGDRTYRSSIYESVENASNEAFSTDSEEERSIAPDEVRSGSDRSSTHQQNGHSPRRKVTKKGARSSFKPNNKSSTKPKTQERIWAEALKGALEAEKPLTVTPNLTKWSSEFTMLRTKRSDEEIQKILDWYCKHIDEQYVPSVSYGNCAKLFREKFVSIESAMKRANKPKTGKQFNKLEPHECW